MSKEADTKACPFCAETIKSAAVICKHCGREQPVRGRAADDEVISLEERAYNLGVRPVGAAWVIKGTHFDQIEDAIEFAKRLPSNRDLAKGTSSFRVRWWHILLLILGGLTFLIANHKPSPETEARWRDEEGIKTCWEYQAKKSLDPATARFHAAVCEKMEADFRTRYHREP